MANNFTQCYQENIFFAFGHYEKFLEICGDDAWNGKTGGWTLAQQYYHGLMATNMLMSSISGKKVSNPNPEAGKLVDKPDILPTKAQAAEFLASLKLGMAAMFESLDDSGLLQKNEHISRMFGREVNNAVVLGLIPAHMLYHLGSCDAGLRDRNLPGAW